MIDILKDDKTEKSQNKRGTLCAHKIRIEKHHFLNLDITKAGFKTLKDCDIEDCIFINCNLSGIRFEACSFNESIFIGCALEDCEFSLCDFSGAVFSGCSLNMSNFCPLANKGMSDIGMCIFIECDITDVSGLVRDDMVNSPTLDECIISPISPFPLQSSALDKLTFKYPLTFDGRGQRHPTERPTEISVEQKYKLLEEKDKTASLLGDAVEDDDDYGEYPGCGAPLIQNAYYYTNKQVHVDKSAVLISSDNTMM